MAVAHGCLAAGQAPVAGAGPGFELNCNQYPGCTCACSCSVRSGVPRDPQLCASGRPLPRPTRQLQQPTNVHHGCCCQCGCSAHARSQSRAGWHLTQVPRLPSAVHNVHQPDADASLSASARTWRFACPVFVTSTWPRWLLRYSTDGTTSPAACALAIVPVKRTSVSHVNRFRQHTTLRTVTAVCAWGLHVAAAAFRSRYTVVRAAAHSGTASTPVATGLYVQHQHIHRLPGRANPLFPPAQLDRERSCANLPRC